MTPAPDPSEASCGRETGLTLIELIVSIAILGVVFSVLSLAMLTAVRTNTETKGRLDETRDQQFAAAYFAGDVAGAIELGSGQPAGCGPAGAEAVVELHGTSFDAAAPGAATVTRVSYVFGPAVAGVAGRTLTRYACETGLPPQADGTPDPRAGPRTTVVARSLTATGAGVACRGAGGTVEPCSATSRTMTLTLDRLSAGGPIVLTGTRRTSP